MKMSKLEKEYLKTQGTRCLFCKSDSLTIGRWKNNGDESTRKKSCNTCGEKWLEIFELVGVDVPEDN